MTEDDESTKGGHVPPDPYVRRLTVSLTADEFGKVQAVVRELAATGRPVSYADAVRECVRRAVT